MNRSTLTALALGLALAAGGCGRYGPPIRPITAAVPTPEPVAESDPTDAADEPVSGKTIETFEDEPIP